MSLKLNVGVLRTSLSLTCECELNTLPSTEAGVAKDLGKNYVKVRSSRLHQFLHNCLLSNSTSLFSSFCVDFNSVLELPVSQLKCYNIV